MSFDYTVVGKRIQRYRLALGKTQEELSELANISKNYLSDIETGKAAGRLDKYYSIAQALGVTVDMLIDNTSERRVGKRLFVFQSVVSARFWVIS